MSRALEHQRLRTGPGHPRSQRIGRRIEHVDDSVLAALQQYDWPGNVRELENTIERAVVLTPGSVITARAVSVAGAATPQKDAAELMGISQRARSYYLAKYGQD